MIGILASMVMSTCFFFAAVKHKERGEQGEANKCAAMSAIGLVLLIVCIVAAA